MLAPGLKIRYHGGWDGSRTERCPVCNFNCAYINPGVIIERYQVWDVASQTFVLHPDNVWLAQIDTGSYVTGYPEQFEVTD